MLTYRAPRKAAEYFKQQDAGTPITEAYIRRLIRDGEIPYLQNGVKQLVCIEQLETYFENQVRG